MSLPGPTNPKSLRCRLGFHQSMWLEADETPVPQTRHGVRMMVMYNNYIDYCPRCGRKKPFEFWIDRS